MTSKKMKVNKRKAIPTTQHQEQWLA